MTQRSPSSFPRFSPRPDFVSLRTRLIAVAIVLGILNLGGWLWAFAVFHDQPGLLGVALLVYGLGLRHAVDADHIAAIDNVTRKLMQDGGRPAGVGLFFALGHATVVVIAVAGLVAAASLFERIEAVRGIGSVIGTAVSATFLLAVAAMNIVIFVGIWRSYRRVRAGGAYVEADLDILLNNRGFLARLVRPLFRLVTRSWHMAPLGFLFGLGFDTATEVAMFGVAAAQAGKGVSVGAILVLPVLFAAGMALVDTLDGVMMLGAYEWAFVKPIRKLYYNMTITLVSVAVALLIGGVEALGLIGEKLELSGAFWEAIGALNENFSQLGFAIIAIFAAAWLVSVAIYKAKGLDDLEIGPASRP